MTKLVRDFMHRGLITCHQNAALGQVAVLLSQHHVHALVVADRDGRPVGILSDYDLLAGEWLSADNDSLAVMRKLCAGDLMSYPITHIDADAPLTDAAELMIEKEINRLVVDEKGKAVAILSTSDLLGSLLLDEPAKRDTVADVMSDAILVCRDKTPVASAARTMNEARYRSVLVVDPRGKPLGIVSDRDLIHLHKNGSLENFTVVDVMHAMLTVDVHATLREAADLMIKHHHHRLVVIDDKDPDTFPLGIVSSFDIVAEMARPGSVWQS